MARSAVCRSVAAAWGPAGSPSAVPADKTAGDVKGEAKALAESVAAVRARQAAGELTGPAPDNQAAWTEESTPAAQQAGYRAVLVQPAPDGEQRVRAAV